MPQPQHLTLNWTESISDGATETHEYNWARSFSRLNRKNFDQTDKNGNCQVYLVRITQQVGDASGNTEVKTVYNTAPHTYVTKNAVKAWHNARVKMLRRLGIRMKQLSPYTRTLKYPLTTSDSYSNELHTGGWENAQFAVAAQLDSGETGALTADDLVDGYTLTLVDDHVVETTAPTTKYTTVGMNRSWLDKRRKPYTLAEGAVETGVEATAIDHETNPLYEIMSGSNIAEEVAEIVQDEQIQEPAWIDADQYGVMAQGLAFSSVHSPSSHVVACPGGLMQAVITDLRSNSAAAIIYWTVELLDVYDM